MGSGEEENLLVSTHPPLWIQDAPIARCSPSSLPAQGGEERGDRERKLRFKLTARQQGSGNAQKKISFHFI